jgi:hypothetical protein
VRTCAWQESRRRPFVSTGTLSVRPWREAGLARSVEGATSACLLAAVGGARTPGAPDTAERSVSCGEFSTSADFRSFGWLCGAVGLVLFAFVLSEPPLLHCVWDWSWSSERAAAFPGGPPRQRLGSVSHANRRVHGRAAGAGTHCVGAGRCPFLCALCAQLVCTSKGNVLCVSQRNPPVKERSYVPQG